MATFDEQVLSDFDALKTSGEHFSSIEYNPDGAGFGTPFDAFVIEGTLDDSELVGFIAEKGQEPLIVQASLTDVPTVTRLKDVVRYNGKEYTVQAVLQQDAGARRLYCVH